jgi:putative tryptophan/tyrosine transport system substrate-binding protein
VTIGTVDRWTFIVTAVGLLAVPLVVEAQPPSGKAARIGYLGFASGPLPPDEAFRQGLRELGYVEGEHIVIEYRWADFKPDRASAFAADLVRLPVDVIVSTGGPIPATAAKKATETIPIVFEAADPVGNDLVTRLDRPGGNLTGVDRFVSELNVKRLELLKEMLPGISRVFVLSDPTSPQHTRRLKELEAAAQLLRVKLHVLEARQPQDINVAFATLARERGEAFLLMTSPMFFTERKRIVDLAAKHRLPGFFFWREFAEVWGLVSYSANLAATRRRLATYVDKILKGAKPADLPVEQPTRFELVINLTALVGALLPPDVPEGHMLRSWLDSWSGVGHVLDAMTAAGHHVELRQSVFGWRAEFHREPPGCCSVMLCAPVFGASIHQLAMAFRDQRGGSVLTYVGLWRRL